MKRVRFGFNKAKFDLVLRKDIFDDLVLYCECHKCTLNEAIQYFIEKSLNEVPEGDIM